MTVISSGLYFGTVCPGETGFEPLEMDGCSGIVLHIDHANKTEAGGEVTDVYNFFVVGAASTKISTLLIFNQPLDLDAITFTGDV